ncbi:GNAT family N-acetyltransferase [Paenibacillus sp. 32352]|uniref:GNAT family N-acetyltransferase n=1 Tax=Paenibacillus sp. 32352 TaxID=1969111 RepID=UPI0009AC881E|nr:GNAT family N-acetyltransferase [Paenibacillus sp. 32352]
MLAITSIQDCPERQMELAEYVKAKWPNVANAVLPQIDLSLSSEGGLPFTFLLLKDNQIIGFYQLIQHEFVRRKDLTPWIAPLFIDEQERGQAYGSVLLEHARNIAGQMGYKKVYLATDHILYYEKYGFREIGLDIFEWGRPTKLYEHDTIM